MQNILIFIEALYHASAMLISMYANITGYSETSPITILRNSIFGMGKEEEKMPIPKVHMVDLKKDVGNIEQLWSEFVYLIYGICDSDIMRKVFVSQEHEVVPEIIKLADISLNMYDNYKNKGVKCTDKMIDKISAVLSTRTGFVVKRPLANPSNCFWLSTNWEKETTLAYGLKDQILVIVVENLENDVEQVKSYLSKKRDYCGEAIWVNDNGKTFYKDQIDKIDNNMKSIDIKSCFIDNEIIDKWTNSDVRQELFNAIPAN